MSKKIKESFKIEILKTIYNSIKYKRKIFVYKQNMCKFEKKAKILNKGSLIIGRPFDGCNIGKGTFLIRKNVILDVNEQFACGANCQVCVEENARLEIDNAFLNRDSKIYCTNHIKIGKDVAVSEGVIIRDSDIHTIINGDKSVQNNTEPIIINNHVWIGMNATILKGVTIGEGSIVGACSVVTKDVPPNVIVAGNPAKIIRENVDWRM